MKILFCHNYYQFAGGESEVFEAELAVLKSYGHSVVLYSRSNNDLKESGLFARGGYFLPGYSSGRTRRELRALCEKERPDVAIVQNVFHLLSPSVYTTLKALGIPVIQAVYNYRFICPEGELFTQGQICERCIGGNYLNTVIHRCYRNSYTQSAWLASIIGLHRLAGTFNRCIDYFMVPDQFLGDKLVQGGIPARKIFRNPNPFFIDAYQPAESHLGYVLYVGRLVPQKGILTLLKAMQSTHQEAGLEVVGHGELFEKVKAVSKQDGLSTRVVLHGSLWGEDLIRKIEGCAALVIPSEWYDNLPQILCQANAMGKPVIASRIDGIPQYIEEGVNGFLFDPRDDGALAQLIDRVLALTAEEYGRLSRSARLYAERVFNYPVHYKKLSEKISELIG